MPRFSDDLSYWVDTFKEDYLKGASDRYDAESFIDDLIERAMESLASDLKSACEEAVEDYYDEDCTNCDGEGTCPFCDSEGTCSTYRGPEDDHEGCEDCKGTNRCQECVTTAGVCESCRGTGKEHDEYGS